MVRWRRRLGQPLFSSVSMARWTNNLKTLLEGWIPPFMIRARSWLTHFVQFCLSRWGWCQGRKLERVLPLLVETLARARIASGTAQLSVMAISSRIYTGGGWSKSAIWTLLFFTDGGSRWSAPSPSSPLPVFLILKWFRIQDLNPSLKYCNVFFCGKYIFIFWRNCWRCTLRKIPCLMKRQSNHSTIIFNLSCLESIKNTYIWWRNQRVLRPCCLTVKTYNAHIIQKQMNKIILIHLRLFQLSIFVWLLLLRYHSKQRETTRWDNNETTTM